MVAVDCRWQWIATEVLYIYIKYISQSRLSSKLMPKTTKHIGPKLHCLHLLRPQLPHCLTRTQTWSKKRESRSLAEGPWPHRCTVGLIEEKPVCLTICGFAGGSSKANGRDLIEHCWVMGDLLLIHHESSWWASEDRQTAGLAVKNRINWLKKNYAHY